MLLFRGKSLQEVTFEIGMLGKYGLDINDLQEATSCGRCRKVLQVSLLAMN